MTIVNNQSFRKMVESLDSKFKLPGEKTIEIHLLNFQTIFGAVIIVHSGMLPGCVASFEAHLAASFKPLCIYGFMALYKCFIVIVNDSLFCLNNNFKLYHCAFTSFIIIPIT